MNILYRKDVTMKLIHNEEYRGFKLYISGRYIDDYYDWNKGRTNAVRLYYEIEDCKGNELKIHDWQYTTVAKEQSSRFLFWEFNSKINFEQQVKNEIEEVISFIKSTIDGKLYEEEMTKGLLDSLKNL